MKILLLNLLLFVNILAFAQNDLKVTEINDLDQFQSVDSRNMIFFIHTNWCGFCKQMQAKTWTNQELISLLNEEYYFLSLDAESKETFELAGKTFSHNKGLNELALALAEDNGRIAYPSLVILNENYELIYRQSGFHSYKQVLKILNRLEELN